MGALLVAAFGVALLSNWLGYRILRALYRKDPEPEIPEAHEVDRRKRARAQAKFENSLLAVSKTLAFVLGATLVAWPWVVIVWIYRA